MSAVMDVSLTDLVNQFAQLKQAEALATQQRIKAEEALIAFLGEPEEGSVTKKLEDGRALTITSKLNRTIDADKWLAIKDRIPPHLSPVSAIESLKLDLKGLRWMQEMRPDLYLILSEALEVRRAKSSVTLKV